MNQLSAPEKLVFSFTIALGAPWAIALVINLFVSNPVVMVAIGGSLSAWTLIGGFQKNGELEESVGGIFGQLTDWVIPTGISWWVPKPLGQSLQKVTIGQRVLERSRSMGNSFSSTRTRDGTIVDVSIIQRWHVVDARKVATYAPGAISTMTDALLSQGVGNFALHFNAHDDLDRPGTALSSRREDFSRFLLGDEEVRGYDDAVIENHIARRASELGIKIDDVVVLEINDPAVVQEARNRAAAEEGQAVAEKKDVNSIRNRVLELMWGTSDESLIATKVSKGESPLMDQKDATRAVRSARKDMFDIHVSGDAGDFTKGSAISQNLKKGV